MILSDLIGLPVHDASDVRLGLVVDVRFVLDGTPHQLLYDAQVYGVLVSPRSQASFLGYERTDNDRPALIARYLSWRERGSFLALWRDVASISRERVMLRPRFTRYSTALDALGSP